jgi:hypothetical protein
MWARAISCWYPSMISSTATGLSCGAMAQPASRYHYAHHQDHGVGVWLFNTS